MSNLFYNVERSTELEYAADPHTVTSFQVASTELVNAYNIGLKYDTVLCISSLWAGLLTLAS